MSDAASYKKLKEDFVSNLSGGRVSEINYVTSVAAAACILWSVLQARQSFFEPYSILAFALDFLLNVGAILLATTLYANSPLLLCLFLIAPAILIFTLPSNSIGRRKRPIVPPNARSKSGSGQLDVLSTKPFLTTYRGCMMIATCVAILAVDFRLFPRRFAKVETWGTSLMDLGVGSFVFSSGVVAARPVLKEKALGRTTGRATPLLYRILYSMRHSTPLLILGVIRLLSVKGLDYAEHVTEYGVHWNFFFTLGFLPPFVALFQAALRVVPSFAALSLIVGVTYQILLETTELKAFLLTAPRVDLISMNREGIFSFFGYLAIFLAGQDTGMYAIPRNIPPKSTASAGAQRNTLLMTMAVWGGVWTALYLLSTNYSYGMGWSVSRRLANLPYVLWVVAFNTLQIFAFCLVDTIFFPAFYNAADAKSEKEAYQKATSRVLRAYNRNGLVVFLIANLLTGAVNLSFRTLDATPITTIGILVGYMATVTGVAVGLDAYDISIKLGFALPSAARFDVIPETSMPLGDAIHFPAIPQGMSTKRAWSDGSLLGFNMQITLVVKSFFFVRGPGGGPDRRDLRNTDAARVCPGGGGIHTDGPELESISAEHHEREWDEEGGIGEPGDHVMTRPPPKQGRMPSMG